MDACALTTIAEASTTMDAGASVSDERSQSDEYWLVEKIVKKKISRGKPLYMVKWKGFPHSDNTWEPVENFVSKYVIQEFEGRIKARKMKKKEVARKMKHLKRAAEPSLKGFDRGLTPQTILDGGLDENVDLLIKWKEVDEPELVSHVEAKLHCAKLVRDFYYKLFV